MAPSADAKSEPMRGTPMAVGTELFRTASLGYPRVQADDQPCSAQVYSIRTDVGHGRLKRGMQKIQRAKNEEPSSVSATTSQVVVL
jgi:hypothetical protein